MADINQVYEKLKTFLDFSSKDEDSLRALWPVVAKYASKITDDFYMTLAKDPGTLALIEGRIDTLKATHTAWIEEVFSGVDGAWADDYMDRRVTIGKIHVKIGLDPYWVEAVMSQIRTGICTALANEISDPAELASSFSSVCKVLDIDLMLINLAYAEERLDRLADCTGLSRVLIENLVKAAE